MAEILQSTILLQSSSNDEVQESTGNLFHQQMLQNPCISLTWEPKGKISRSWPKETFTRDYHQTWGMGRYNHV